MKHTPLFATLILLFTLATGSVHANQSVININSADAVTLTSLDGIGHNKAEAIVAYREANGPFKTPEDLAKVKGIGERTVEKNAERISVK
ncbi:ComEA family DNA-binding protein [Marinobacter sp. ANT_B65]|uniref:ComEA family DNA-binding protein n=1 Tax=Marinobacter sp. ANT_B65 TaxID=2039467 RepID=UPI000BBEB09C|nr:ComEA family DNA-binding protein [Marinobacter sp. ANT_B65]PCM45013.1 competence protein ComEA [Marinobacter sp. ANT_B65]